MCDSVVSVFFFVDASYDRICRSSPIARAGWGLRARMFIRTPSLLNLNTYRMRFLRDLRLNNTQSAGHHPRRGRRVLELGCGCGYVGIVLAALGADVESR